MPSACRFDGQGRLRLVMRASSFAQMVDAAFDQIRQNARSNPAVAIRMLGAIAQVAEQVRSPQDAACLRRHAGMIVRGARESVPEADDRLAVEASFTAAVQALAAWQG